MSNSTETEFQDFSLGLLNMRDLLDPKSECITQFHVTFFISWLLKLLKGPDSMDGKTNVLYISFTTASITSYNKQYYMTQCLKMLHYIDFLILKQRIQFSKHQCILFTFVVSYVML